MYCTYVYTLRVWRDRAISFCGNLVCEGVLSVSSVKWGGCDCGKTVGGGGGRGSSSNGGEMGGLRQTVDGHSETETSISYIQTHMHTHTYTSIFSMIYTYTYCVCMYVRILLSW